MPGRFGDPSRGADCCVRPAALQPARCCPDRCSAARRTATGSLGGGRFSAGDRRVALRRGLAAGFVRADAAAALPACSAAIRANVALSFEMSAAASTGTAIDVSPAFGVFDVSSVAIGGNVTRLSKSCSGAQIPNPAFANAQLGEPVVHITRLVAIGVAVHPGLDRVEPPGRSIGGKLKQLVQRLAIKCSSPALSSFQGLRPTRTAWASFQ
jgi:hypothetical protein